MTDYEELKKDLDKWGIYYEDDESLNDDYELVGYWIAIGGRDSQWEPRGQVAYFDKEQKIVEIY